MSALLDDPAVQAGLAPLLAALATAALLRRTRVAWLALVVAVATAFALTSGISFSPLTAARKTLLVILAAPLAGLALDARPARGAAAAALFGLASVWVYWSVLSQRELAESLVLGGGVAVFVALAVLLALRLRGDGAAGAAATLALGLAVATCAFLAASIGNFVAGIALAAGAGALLLLQFGLGEEIRPGALGMLSAGVAAALFAATTFVLAELRWFVLPLLLLPLLAAALPVARGAPLRLRLTLLCSLALTAAAVPVLAAWLAAGGVSAS